MPVDVFPVLVARAHRMKWQYVRSYGMSPSEAYRAAWQVVKLEYYTEEVRCCL